MRLPVFADVHSNIHSLRAVLEDINGRQPDITVCTGDLVGYAPFPNEVIAFHRIACGCDYANEEAMRLALLSGNRNLANH